MGPATPDRHQMFFYLSKIIGFALQPMVILLGLFLAGYAVKYLKFPKTGNALNVTGIALLALIICTPFSNWLLIPLEERFPPPKPPEDIAGIVVLGGAISGELADTRLSLSYTSAADRLIVATNLARNRYPNVPIIFTGGSNGVFETELREADYAQQYFNDAGLDQARMHYERNSRNTFENAVFSKVLADKIVLKFSNEKLPWIIITSAFHMPRTIGTFRKAGWGKIIPWPVDFQTRGAQDYFYIPRSVAHSIMNGSVAIRAWIGLLAYRITGRTNELFPSP